MTDWNLAFDYATMTILLLIAVWYVNEKKIPMQSYSFFWVLLGNVFLATSFEIFSTLAARYVDVIGYQNFFVLLTIQTLFIDLVPISMAYYLLLLSHVDFDKRRWVPNLFKILAILVVVIVTSNYFYRWVFVFEEEKFQLLWGSVIPYGIAVAMVMVCFITMFRHKNRFTFLKPGPFSFNMVCGVVACVLQLVLYIPLVDLMLGLLCLTFFYYQQNSNKVIDNTTNQFNRKLLGEYLNNAFYEEKSFGVITVAMDDFKLINKNYGVDTGDNLLYQVGAYLEQLKYGQLVFRYGSDKFCIILPKNTSMMSEVAVEVGERFCHPWTTKDSLTAMMSASIFCMECPKDAGSYRELVDVIDYSMAVAKKTKKGSIISADEIKLEQIQRDKEIEKAVKIAMDKKSLMVYYQPIFSIEKGIYNSAEALVRLNDEQLGWISPEEFIPIAEKNGLIVEMGEIIFEKICRFIHDFRLHNTLVEYIEVNISPLQLMQYDFADKMISLMERYEVKPHQINIEITETANMSISVVIEKNINKLVQYGITLSLDDYGSGNANIGYINQLPFKIIKIDKGIIWDSFKNQKAGVTLEYTIGMLNALDLYIVAEGVETKEMMERLKEYGCHYMQGWYYSKAVPDKEFMKLIEVQ